MKKKVGESPNEKDVELDPALSVLEGQGASLLEDDKELLEDIDTGEDNSVVEPENIPDDKPEEVKAVPVSTEDEELVKVREAYIATLKARKALNNCEAEIISVVLEMMDNKKMKYIKDLKTSKNKLEDIKNEVSPEIFAKALASIDTSEYANQVFSSEYQKASLGKQIFSLLRKYLSSFGVKDTAFSLDTSRV
jgi:hypothetical protein